MNVNQSIGALCVLGVLWASYGLVAAQDHGKQKGHEIDYKNTGTWVGEKCSIGQFQTPINITGAVKAVPALPALAIAYAGKQPATFQKNDHEVPQVDYVVKKARETWPQGTSGRTLGFGNLKYDLKQFHFHTKSENKIDGVGYEMEGHFVHYTDKGAAAVLAVMFELGKPNDKLATLWEKLPTLGPKNTFAGNPEELLPDSKSRGYYSFEGSLTTPPCSEGLRWLVLKTPVSISQAQVKAFRDTLPGKLENARPLQKLFSRTIQQ